MTRREFANVWLARWLREARQDVRVGLRLFRQNPLITLSAVCCLALGIGANTAAFSLVNAIVLRDLPVRNPGELVELMSRREGERPRSSGFSWEVYARYRDQNHVFADLIGTSAVPVRVSAKESGAESASGEYVSGNFFSALGLTPSLGRLLNVQDDRPGGEAVPVVLGWSYWQRRFGADPSIVGRPLTIGTVQAVVAGVAPREFASLQVGTSTDVWMPAAASRPQPGRQWANRFAVQLIGRLRTGVSVAQAEAEMRVLDRGRVEELAKISGDRGWLQNTLVLGPAAAGFARLRDTYSRPLLIVTLLVALLLGIACTNVASMLLARSAARQQEMAVRTSLGAGPLRLARQVLAESLLLAGTSSVVAIVLAYAGSATLVRIVASGQPLGASRPIEISVAPDANVLLFTAGLAVLTAIVFGMAPAWAAFATAPASALRETRGGESRSRRLFGRSLIVAQVVLSVVLLGVAGLFAQHLSNLRNVDLGFEYDSVLLVTLDASNSGHAPEERAVLFEDLLGRLKAIPGVRGASLSNVTPIQGTGAASFIRVNGLEEAPEARQMVALNWVGPGYFDALGTPLRAGRDFQFEDAGRTPVAIVNESVVRRYFRHSNPIGQQFTLERQNQPYEIVGVVADAKYADLRQPAPETIYFGAFQENRGVFSQFVLRTSGARLSVVPEVRRAVSGLLRNVTITKIVTLSDQLDASIVPERLTAWLSSGLGALGAALAAIGLYGLLAYTVARRTSEIGIRIALGASRGSIAAQVLRSALATVGIGIALGVPLALWSTRFAANAMGVVSVSATFVVAIAAAILAGVALLSVIAPLRSATRIEPVAALRHQ